MSAGSGATNNLIRSLRTGDATLDVFGCHWDRFILKKSSAERNYLIPPSDHPDHLPGLRRIIQDEHIGVLIPASDQDVQTVSRLRARIPCRLFLPPSEIIDLCQDKYALVRFLRDRGLPAPLTYAVSDRRSIGRIFSRLAPPTPLWCRMRTGSGSMGATPVNTPAQARSWVQYWEDLRGVPASAFTLSEYLPGREFSVQGLWLDGRPVLIKMCECVLPFGGWNQPSASSSTPALARTVEDPRVIKVCEDVMHAVGPTVSGVFSIDLKEDVHGTPCVTEINPGRFCMITSIYDLTGQHNMALTYVRLALGEPVDIADPLDVAEDFYLVRDLDTLPGVFHADEFFEGIREVSR